jgi:multiple sugar transport system substrate-binding protein
MKRFKKTVALLLVLAMAISAWGCSKDDTKETNGDASKAPAETDAATEPAETKGVEIVGDESVENPFYVYSWNEETGARLEYFKEAYPQYADRIVYVNTGGSDTYQDKIDPLLQTPDNAQYPDLIALEADYIIKYTDSDQTIPVSELGITEKDMENMYDYTVEIAKVNDQVKALSWQATPGAMMYRRSLAKKYLGTEDPAEVQKLFKDWDTMLKTAREIQKKSNGVTKLFSGNDDVARVFTAGREKAWINDDVLSVDDKMLEYMDFVKVLEEEKLTNRTKQWDDAWNANVQSDKTFAYMGCTWFLHYTLKPNCGAKFNKKTGELVAGSEEGSTYGDWAMIEGPQTYYWGGTWLAATKECSDPELAGLIMKTLTCDTELMAKLSDETMDYVNNKASIQKLLDEGKGAYDFLDGQNYLEVFSPLADKVTIPKMVGEDFYINTAFLDQVDQYSQGKKDKKTALEDFKSGVLDSYTYLTAE